MNNVNINNNILSILRVYTREKNPMQNNLVFLAKYDIKYSDLPTNFEKSQKP